MSFLDELKTMIAADFEKAKDKDEIVNIQKKQELIDKAIEEEKKSTTEYNALFKDYKEALKYSVAQDKKGENEPTAQAPDFDSMLAEAIAQQNKN